LEVVETLADVLALAAADDEEGFVGELLQFCEGVNGGNGVFCDGNSVMFGSGIATDVIVVVVVAGGAVVVVCSSIKNAVSDAEGLEREQIYHK
jgi:hypothetical protein